MDFEEVSEFTMKKYFLKRFFSLVPKLIIISLVIFFALQMLPGDPITRTVSPDIYKNMTAQQLDNMRENLGLNDSLMTQYFRWVGKLFRGDLGYSMINGASISEMMASRLPATIELAFWALLVANFLGILFGYLAALHQNTMLDYGCTAFSVIAISVPEFFFGLLFILLFSLKLDWFPTGGRMGYGDEGFFQRIQYMILPVFTLAIAFIAVLMRYTRSSMMDVMNKDYIKTARSKGLSEFNVNLKHGLRNAMIPVMVTLCFRLPILVGGTVMVETVFNYPGMGKMVLDALSGSDMTVVMVTTLLIAMVVLLSSFILDLFTAVLDPRVRFNR